MNTICILMKRAQVMAELHLFSRSLNFNQHAFVSKSGSMLRTSVYIPEYCDIGLYS